MYGVRFELQLHMIPGSTYEGGILILKTLKPNLFLCVIEAFRVSTTSTMLMVGLNLSGHICIYVPTYR